MCVQYGVNAGPGPGPWALTHKWLWIWIYPICDSIGYPFIRGDRRGCKMLFRIWGPKKAPWRAGRCLKNFLGVARFTVADYGPVGTHGDPIRGRKYVGHQKCVVLRRKRCAVRTQTCAVLRDQRSAVLKPGVRCVETRDVLR